MAERVDGEGANAIAAASPRERLARWLYRTHAEVLAPSDPSWTDASTLAQLQATVSLAQELIAEATVNDAQRPPIYVDHFVSVDVNAIAGRLPDGVPEGFFILISAGCRLRLFQVFAGLLSLPSFEPQIGTPSLEREPLEPAYTSLDPLKTPLVRFSGATRDPLDAVRQRAADLLTSAALEFVVLHELGHVRNGHLLLSPESHALTEVAPFERGNLTNQTLEMDADSHAAVHLLNRELLFSLRVQGALAGGLDRSSVDVIALEALFGTEERALATYLLATYVAFRFMGPAAWDGTFVWAWDHPPAIVRLFGTLEVTDANLGRTRHAGIAALAGERLVKLASATSLSVEAGLASLYGYQVDPIALLEPSVVAVGEYNRVLGAEWRKLHPSLDRLKLGGALAPD